MIAGNPYVPCTPDMREAANIDPPCGSVDLMPYNMHLVPGSLSNTSCLRIVCLLILEYGNVIFKCCFLLLWIPTRITSLSADILYCVDSKCETVEENKNHSTVRIHLSNSDANLCALKDSRIYEERVETRNPKPIFKRGPNRPKM